MIASQFAMGNRSDTFSNLNRISHISEKAHRKPLNAATLDNLPSESSSEDDRPEEKTELGVSLRLRHRAPKVVSDEKVESLDKKEIATIIQSLTNGNNKRLARSKSKGTYKSNFADINVDPVLTTIFDSDQVKQSQFYGFYILFWLGTGFMILQNAVRAYFNDGVLIYKAPVFRIMMTGLWQIALTDLMMYLSIYFAYFVQYLCYHGWIQWFRSGWIIQSVYELVFFAFWMIFPSELYMGFQWIGRVFLTLHMMVLLMKMHSYAFYNGYLWSILREVQFSESYLIRIQAKTAKLPEPYTEQRTKELLRESIAFCRFELLHQSMLLAKDPTSALEKSVEALQDDNEIKFPANINFWNYFQYTMYPTVVYELVAPRTKRIRWKFVGEKICATIGVIFLMLLVAENSIYPAVLKSNIIRESLSGVDKARMFCLLLIEMIPAFLLEYLLVFFLIWDVILNEIAELSRFADRDFYGPWWSCVDWFEYARFWNKPVHRFLLRHVYHSSISALSLNKNAANFVTFILSSIVHEIVMYVIFGRWRGYLFAFQMSQIPMALISRTALMRNQKVFGNVVCWFGFVSGPAIICTLYLVY